MSIRHPTTCSCCDDLFAGKLDRRSLIKLTAAAGVATAFPFLAFAAEGNYEAMLLYCIDPRVPALTLDYMKGRDMLGKYSQFVIAGAAIGVVAPAFRDWRTAFWENLASSIKLHNIKKVIALDHRDCGAAKIAYGAAAVATHEAEMETHRRALARFRHEVGHRQPKLAVETGLTSLDGKVEMFG